MTRILYFLLIFNSINFLNAKTNAIYFELLGSGLTYSINYEKTISDHISLRTGLGSFTLKDKENFAEISLNPILVGANFMIGRKWKIETGFGISYWLMNIDGLITEFNFDFIDSAEEDILNYYFNLGLRYQNPKGGIMFKLGLGPTIIVDFNGQSGTIPLPYLSMGYSF